MLTIIPVDEWYEHPEIVDNSASFRALSTILPQNRCFVYIKPVDNVYKPVNNLYWLVSSVDKVLESWNRNFHCMCTIALLNFLAFGQFDCAHPYAFHMLSLCQ